MIWVTLESQAQPRALEREALVDIVSLFLVLSLARISRPTAVGIPLPAPPTRDKPLLCPTNSHARGFEQFNSSRPNAEHRPNFHVIMNPIQSHCTHSSDFPFASEYKRPASRPAPSVHPLDYESVLAHRKDKFYIYPPLGGVLGSTPFPTFPKNRVTGGVVL